MFFPIFPLLWLTCSSPSLFYLSEVTFAYKLLEPCNGTEEPPSSLSRRAPTSPGPTSSSSDWFPGPWLTCLFACFEDPANCCITCWCPCVTFGRIAEIADRGGTSFHFRFKFTCIYPQGLFVW
ncbi:hypothetical protein AMTRI_Chr04g250650 [Amborella trichopoda]